MNSIDDFSRLRPDVTAVDDDHLERLWTQLLDRTVTADEPVHRPAPGSDVNPTPPAETETARAAFRSRRWAVLGAAATIMAGVGAVALIADRAEAPTSTFEPGASASIVSAVPVTTSGPPADDRTVAVDEPPRWGIDEPGWTLTGYDDVPGDRADTVRLFAGPAGLGVSWVAITSGMSDPFGTRGLADGADTANSDDGAGVEGEIDGPPAPITSRRIVDAHGNFLVVAGGVTSDVAESVFDARESGARPPAGFEEVGGDAGTAAQRRVAYRFENEAGDTIDVDVESGGRPRFDVERGLAEATEFANPPAGVDAAAVVASARPALLMQTGFWVSTVRVSASGGSTSDFASLVDLLQLVPDDVWRRSLPDQGGAPSSVERLVIGDSRSLDAADELTDLGFSVDAVDGRSFRDGIDTLDTLSAQGRIPAAVVVALGSDVRLGLEDVDDMLDALVDVPTVVFVTSDPTGGPSDVLAGNDELVRAIPAARPDVTVVDWEEQVEVCPGDCVAADGRTLTEAGQRHYADLIDAASSN